MKTLRLALSFGILGCLALATTGCDQSLDGEYYDELATDESEFIIWQPPVFAFPDFYTVDVDHYCDVKGNSTYRVIEVTVENEGNGSGKSTIDVFVDELWAPEVGDLGVLSNYASLNYLPLLQPGDSYTDGFNLSNETNQGGCHFINIIANTRMSPYESDWTDNVYTEVVCWNGYGNNPYC